MCAKLNEIKNVISLVLFCVKRIELNLYNNEKSFFAHRMLELDGSLMEGGGQLMRMSVGFSALLKKPVKIFNIRGKRSKPGLKAQHLAGIRLVRDIVGAELTGDELHSTEIRFVPSEAEDQRVKKRNFAADTGTAGATTLLAQVALPSLIFAPEKPVEATLKGGTDAEMAPMADFTREIFLPNLRRFGANFELRINKKGYFPKGGGEIVLRVEEPDVSTPLKAVDLSDPGEIVRIHVRASVAGKLPLKIAEEMSDAAKNILLRHFDERKVEVKVESLKEEKFFGNGSSILIKAETSTGCVLGGSAIGGPKVKPWKTGEKAAREILQCRDVCLDQWTQDQVIMFAALAHGTSKFLTTEPTLHTETAIHISRVLSGAEFKVEEVREGKFMIECRGIGYKK